MIWRAARKRGKRASRDQPFGSHPRGGVSSAERKWEGREPQSIRPGPEGGGMAESNPP